MTSIARSRTAHVCSEQARQEADDAVQHAKFREQARNRFIEEGRDPDDEAELKSAIFRERKMWIRERTTELGAERAEYWGWTNIYTYSKSLAEQIIASQDDIVKVLVRPSRSSNRRINIRFRAGTRALRRPLR